LLTYWARRYLRFGIPLAGLEYATFLSCARGVGIRRHFGLDIVAYPPVPLVALEDVVRALDLLRTTDLRRFERARRFLRRIAVRAGKPTGYYLSIGKFCGLRMVSAVGTSSALVPRAYAGTIVHEATHGLLDARKFPYTRATKQRIERICSAEKARFLARFPKIGGRLPLVFGPGDPGFWGPGSWAVHQVGHKGFSGPRPFRERG
jgi:hypothetical protein